MVPGKALVLTLVAVLGHLAALASSQHVEPSLLTNDAAELIDETYDHIVIGAGLAGMVVASRLSEDRHKRVLLIEAGNDTRRHPLVRTVRLDNDELQIKVASREQSGGRRIVHSLGTGLGGSTSINGAKVDGPPSSQIDAIKEFGNPSWSWDSVLTYMKKSQNYRAPGPVAAAHGATYDPAGHGIQGPVDVTFAPQSYTGHPQDCFIRALNATLGIDKIIDAGAGDAVGFSYCPHFIRDGTNLTRVSSATAYYSPIEFERSNLHVLAGWRGIRINLQDEKEATSHLKTSWASSWQRPFFAAAMAGRVPPVNHDASKVRASSVTVQSFPGGPTFDLSLRNPDTSEVIVSAGALFSPLILELSGIGDPAILSALKIANRVNLPGVGRNLADKPTNTLAATSRGLHRHGIDGDPLNAVAMLPIDRIFSNVSDMEASIRSKMSVWARDLVSNGAAVNEDGILRQYEVMLDGIFRKSWPVAEWELFSRKIIAIKSFVLQPFSRGFIHSKTLNSIWNTEGDDVDLHGQFYTGSIDMDVQVGSMRAARRVLASRDMREVWGDETSPGTEHVADDDMQRGFTNGKDEGIERTTDEKGSERHDVGYQTWRKYILDTYDVICHNFGTAAMMSREYGGVVDEQFKVYGTHNVRVVDASIFPMQLSAHPSLTIFGVAEKAADVIRGNLPFSS